MIIPDLHPWPSAAKEALNLQHELAHQAVFQAKLPKNIRWVAGLDVSGATSKGPVWAAAVVLELPDFTVIERTFAVAESSFPYVPGLLSFREIPILLEALKKLSTTPDLFICDGQGLAHPRFFGLACHLGIWLDRPTIGCAKSRLVGEAAEPSRAAGSYEYLFHRGRKIGTVVRTREGVKPVWVSPGHLVDIDTARELVLRCCDGRRLPEPTRQAHIEVNKYRKNLIDGHAI